LRSCSTAILIAALSSTARADDGPAAVAQPAPAYPPAPLSGSEVAQPAPAYPPPPAVRAPEVVQPLPPPPPPRPAHRPGPALGERRHHVGGQIGGTGIIQIIYRLRVLGPIYLEGGGMGVTHGANFSTGIVIGASIADRWFPYVGFGGGVMFSGYPTPKTPCDSTMGTCPDKYADDLSYLHARVGLGFGFGATRRQMISLDVGGWYGTHRESWNDTTVPVTRVSETIAMPMAGLSYFYAIH
jgi:hypothetical protein